MSGDDLPRARLRRASLLGLAVWVVPVVAALVAGLLVYQRMQEYGPAIAIRFRDGGGLRVGQTAIKYRGVQVGEVRSLELSPDEQYVLVGARLRRSAEALARDGAMFWIVRPQVGFGSITGLGTVITGPEIEVLPGAQDGAPQREFTGLERAPVAMEKAGLAVVLTAARARSIRPDTPVLYHGVEVGVVQAVDLSPDATAARIHLLIFERYAHLVRSGSAFWNASGASIKAGLLKGLDVKVESLRALAVGGIEFASPEGSPRAKPGVAFPLHTAPKREWLAWNPRLPIGKEK
ncbi:MAG TPA: MlaD family protein [Burkholderiales bacterium]|nr:MlaD family protein [Burkholderiales bacterium]